MAENWRLLDTGLASPARNIALNRALLEARHAEEIPSTLRFSRFTRCALLAPNHSAVQELDLDYCREHDLPLQRRITAGPASYLDERQLVFELYLHRREIGDATHRTLARRLSHAAATALTALGVPAQVRGRFEIEAGGRTLGSSGLAIDGDAVLFQGVLFIDADPTRMLGILRTPWNHARDALESEAAARFTSITKVGRHTVDMRLIKQNLVEAFESEFDAEFREADPGLSEQARYEIAMAGVESRDWVDHIARPAEDVPLRLATHTTAAGTLAVAITYERNLRVIRRVWLTCGAVLKPRRANADFEAALSDVPLVRLAQRVNRFFASHPVDAGGFEPGDFVAVLKRAASRPLLAGNP